MRLRNTVVMILLTCCASLPVGIVIAMPLPGQSTGRVRIGEIALRKIALKQIAPEFPQQSLAQGEEGVAVAQVEVDAKGLVTKVRILQSPDEPTGKSVEDAVKQWIFRPMSAKGVPVAVVGKLTFYFQIASGKGIVKNPQEMPVGTH